MKSLESIRFSHFAAFISRLSSFSRYDAGPSLRAFTARSEQISPTCWDAVRLSRIQWATFTCNWVCMGLVLPGDQVEGTQVITN